MRIHVGRHTLAAINESARILGAADLAATLDSLESEATNHEKVWGGAELFIEVTLTPRVNERPTEIDLLLCFKDRAAVIAMERRGLRGEELQRLRNRLASSRGALRRRARASGWDEKCIVPIVFVPEAEVSDITELRIALNATPDRDFVVASVHRDASFLTTTCMRALEGLAIRPGPLGGHLARVFRRSIDHYFSPPFPSLSLARVAHNEVPTKSPHLPEKAGKG